jgi:hypothetical protein
VAWSENGRAAVCEIVTANAGVIGDTRFADGLAGSRTLPKPAPFYRTRMSGGPPANDADKPIAWPYRMTAARLWRGKPVPASPQGGPWIRITR